MNFRITYRLPVFGNNKLHADIFINRIRAWLIENVEEMQYYISYKYEDSGISVLLPGVSGRPPSLIGDHLPSYNVKMLFFKEEDRNLFQLVWNRQLNEFGAENIKTSLMD